MKYKTELHCHTAPVSACGKSYPKETVEAYIDQGYTTVVLTNHLSRFTYNNKRMGDLSGLDWEEKVKYYVDGYRALKDEAGDRLNILLGCELRSNLDENDYLIYGIDEGFLLSMTNFYDIKISEISAAIKEKGFLFIQAHPFRNSMMVKDPALLDGIEIYNGGQTHDSRNDIARIWAERFSLIGTSGSDFHLAREGAITGGILTDEPITSNEQLVSIIRSGRYELIRNADIPY